MIFDGRSIFEIGDDEIDALVTSRSGERQHVEYKVTIGYKEEAQRLEVLRDITSLANGGGGYLIVGIRDDGSGRAVKYEPGLVGDVEAIQRSVKQLCLEYISERIDGLEMDSRVINGNSG